MLVRYVRKNKIRSMGNKEMEKKERMCVSVPPHCRELKKRKKNLFILFHFFWPKILRKEEGVLASCLVWKRIRRRFGHTCI